MTSSLVALVIHRAFQTMNQHRRQQKNHLAADARQTIKSERSSIREVIESIYTVHVPVPVPINSEECLTRRSTRCCEPTVWNRQRQKALSRESSL